MLEARHVSISIARAPDDVYAYASQLANLAAWASGVSDDMLVVFTPHNELGVLDHDVTVGGQTFHNPMRVVPNADGSEVVFTLLRQPGTSDADFARDAATIAGDLTTLKQLLERT